MTLHVLFTKDGIPGWIGDQPREGSEEMAATVRVGKQDVACDIAFLAAHRRAEKGVWVPRDPPPPPTPDELAAREAQREAARAEEQARRAEEREERFERRAITLLIKRVGGEITQAQFNARIAELRAKIDAEG